MADQTDHFMREVQEEMRRERLAGIWDRYGVFIIAAAVLLVLAVGGYKYAEYRSLIARQAAGVEFESAARLAAQGKAQEAHKAFEAMIKNAPPGYGALARLRNAGAYAAEGKRDEAVAASATYPGFSAHPFPTCFVCGPERAEGDGLRLFPGRLPDGRTAT